MSPSTVTTFLGGAAAVAMLILAVHAWGGHGVAGAREFAVWSVFMATRLVVDVFALAAPGDGGVPLVVMGHVLPWLGTSALLVFTLRFAGFDRFSTKVGVPLLVAASVAVTAVVVTNDTHRLFLRSSWSDGWAHVVLGPAGWGLVVAGSLLALAAVATLVVMLLREGRRRGPIMLVIAGVLLMWASGVLPLLGWSRSEGEVVARAAAALLFAIALYRYGLLRLVPVAREAALEQMGDGYLVLDPAGRIADLNPEAERVFAVPAKEALGRDARAVLPGFRGLDAVLGAVESGASELRIGSGDSERVFEVLVTLLHDHGGAGAGRVLLVHDVTDIRRVEVRAREQERALAALEEREYVARELHDGIAQVLGYLRLQAEAARQVLRSDPATAEAYLKRSADAALDAHGEVRAFIAGARASLRGGVIPAMGAALRRVGETAGLATHLEVAGLEDDAVAPPVAVHLLRIVQEALHNVRKHARATRVTVTCRSDGAWMEVDVEDDGVGLAAASAGAEDDRGFGLLFMHERARAVGGTLAVGPAPGGGTRVTVRVPRRGAAEAGAAAAFHDPAGIARG
jgi:PAS domain S-box-containing protein